MCRYSGAAHTHTHTHTCHLYSEIQKKINITKKYINIASRTSGRSLRCDTQLYILFRNQDGCFQCCAVHVQNHQTPFGWTTGEYG